MQQQHSNSLVVVGLFMPYRYFTYSSNMSKYVWTVNQKYLFTVH